MAIPKFLDSGVLPPFILGDPTNQGARSPYRATMLEVVAYFCTSPDRAKLLLGLNSYREHLRLGGFVSGYQWLDGSFVENVEKLRGRSPADIDVVTLFDRPIKYSGQPANWQSDYRNFLHAEYFDTKAMKPRFRCDTYSVDLAASGRALVRNTTYWFGLFTDVRDSSAKKGIVEVPLSVDPMEHGAVDQAIRRAFSV